jgi:hypothetical protein
MVPLLEWAVSLTKRLESAISIFILVILVLIAVGVLLKQSDSDMTRFGIDTAVKSPTQPAVDEELTVLNSLTPPGFKVLSKAKVYDTGNLYEKIDGEAPLYIDAGFKKLFNQSVMSNADDTLWAEIYIYDMVSAGNAFTVYSQQRRETAENIQILDPLLGYKTTNGLYFVHGRYYIELVGSTESPELFDAITEIAKNIKLKLAADGDTQIAKLQLFPKERLIPGSIKIYKADAFGFEKLKDIFTAQYKIGDQTVTAFLSKRADANDARTITKSYRKFLFENGAAEKNPINSVLAGSVIDFSDTTEIIVTIGPFMAGIHAAENQKAAEDLAIILINRLKEVNK